MAKIQVLTINSNFLQGTIKVINFHPIVYQAIKKQLAENLELAIKLYHIKLRYALSVWGSVSQTDVNRYKLQSVAQRIQSHGGLHVPKRYKKQRYTVARSKPGQAPFRQTGQLYYSVLFDINKRTLYASVYSDTIYARALELGYPNKRLLPRPAWLRVFYRTYRTMLKVLSTNVFKIP